MRKITDISVQKKNKERVNLYIDGEFFCGMDAVVALSERLKAGDEIDNASLERIAKLSKADDAFQKASAYLGIRPRTRREITRYLSDKGFSTEEITQAADRLASYGYIDDYAYTKSYIGQKYEMYGEFKLRAKLYERGVDRKIIDEVLAEMDGQEDAAYRAGRKYVDSKGFDRQKLSRHLASKGFSWDDVSAAISRLKKEEDEED